MSWTRITIIVPASRRASGNILAAALDPDSGGAGTFTAGYSATGTVPATHYVSSGLYSPPNAALLLSGDAAVIHAAAVQAAAARGLEYTQTQNAVSLLLSAATVVPDTDPEVLLGPIGLKPAGAAP